MIDEKILFNSKFKLQLEKNNPTKKRAWNNLYNTIPDIPIKYVFKTLTETFLNKKETKMPNPINIKKCKNNVLA